MDKSIVGYLFRKMDHTNNIIPCNLASKIMDVVDGEQCHAMVGHERLA